SDAEFARSEKRFQSRFNFASEILLELLPVSEIFLGDFRLLAMLSRRAAQEIALHIQNRNRVWNQALDSVRDEVSNCDDILRTELSARLGLKQNAGFSRFAHFEEIRFFLNSYMV